MSKNNVRIINRFQYYAEDCDCTICLNWRGKKHGCTLPECCCGDVRKEAVKADRIKRKRGWNKWQ